MTPGEVRRFYSITRTFLSYGLDELIPKMQITLPLRLWCCSLFWIPNRHKDKPPGERLRLALQELGPIWIKLGQMLSTRRDLFPPHIADQLALSQDRIAPFDGFGAKRRIEEAMGGLSVEEWFDDLKIIPLASASIAQVHTVRSRPNGREVVIRAIRPDILPVIKTDLKLIYRLACWVPRLLLDGRRLRPTGVVREYEKTLVDELNLLRESVNAVRLRHNSEGNSILYIPEVYSDYYSQNMVMVERTYGIPVSDVITFEKNSTNMKLLAERGVQTFSTQAFRNSFLHAGMCPGDIFVSYGHPESPKYTDIDCGIMGSLNREDKRYLAENFITFFNHNYRKAVELHMGPGQVPSNTSVEEFESVIRTVYGPIFEKPLAEISFGHALLNLFNITRRLNMGVQSRLVLPQKTLLYVEGAGRQLCLQLDSWKTAKPFLESWIKNQAGIPALARAFKEKVPFWVEKMSGIPKLVYDSLRRGEYLQYSVDKVARELHANHTCQGRPRYLLSIGATLLLSGTFLLVSRPERGLMPGWLAAGGVVAWLTG